MQLEAKQAAGPVDIADPYLEEEQWDMEAMVLSTIAGQLEDEEEEEVLDQVEKVLVDEWMPTLLSPGYRAPSCLHRRLSLRL